MIYFMANYKTEWLFSVLTTWEKLDVKLVQCSEKLMKITLWLVDIIEKCNNFYEKLSLEEVYDLKSMAYFDHTCAHSYTPNRATCTALQAACKHLCDLTMLHLSGRVSVRPCILYQEPSIERTYLTVYNCLSDNKF